MWETIIDFTEIDQNGIELEKVMSMLMTKLRS